MSVSKPQRSSSHAYHAIKTLIFPIVSFVISAHELFATIFTVSFVIVAIISFQPLTSCEKTNTQEKKINQKIVVFITKDQFTKLPKEVYSFFFQTLELVNQTVFLRYHIRKNL